MTYDCIHGVLPVILRNHLSRKGRLDLPGSVLIHFSRVPVHCDSTRVYYGEWDTGFHMYHDLISRHNVSTKYTLTFPILEP
jgi:hypothetical protein